MLLSVHQCPPTFPPTAAIELVPAGGTVADTRVRNHSCYLCTFHFCSFLISLSPPAPPALLAVHRINHQHAFKIISYSTVDSALVFFLFIQSPQPRRHLSFVEERFCRGQVKSSSSYQRPTFQKWFLPGLKQDMVNGNMILKTTNNA